MFFTVKLVLLLSGVFCCNTIVYFQDIICCLWLLNVLNVTTQRMKHRVTSFHYWGKQGYLNSDLCDWSGDCQDTYEEWWLMHSAFHMNHESDKKTDWWELISFWCFYMSECNMTVINDQVQQDLGATPGKCVCKPCFTSCALSRPRITWDAIFTWIKASSRKHKSWQTCIIIA